MSIVKTSSVFCDGYLIHGFDRDRCKGWIAEVADSQGGTRKARRQAITAGWTRREVEGVRVDLCPACTETFDGVES